MGTAMARPMTVVLAALAYWAVVFAFAFALGTVRTLWLAPLLGSPTLAVAMELPLVLAASWSVARRVVRQWRLGPGECVATGAAAFALLMGAELALATWAFGQTAQGWLAAQFRLPGALGLAGQLVFAAMPLAVRAGFPRKWPKF